MRELDDALRPLIGSGETLYSGYKKVEWGKKKKRSEFETALRFGCLFSFEYLQIMDFN